MNPQNHSETSTQVNGSGEIFHSLFQSPTDCLPNRKFFLLLSHRWTTLPKLNNTCNRITSSANITSHQNKISKMINETEFGWRSGLPKRTGSVYPPVCALFSFLVKIKDSDGDDSHGKLWFQFRCFSFLSWAFMGKVFPFPLVPKDHHQRWVIEIHSPFSEFLSALIALRKLWSFCEEVGEKMC